jgi:hypothetical protein
VNSSYRIHQDINPISFVKGVPIGGESPKVDKPPSPQAEKSAGPGNAQGLTSTVGIPTSSFHTIPCNYNMNIAQRPEPTEMPEVIPLSPWSYGLITPGGPHTDEGSSIPSSGAQL